MGEDAWYSDRRASWKPEHVRLLLVAESAPDDGSDVAGRRFFYDTRLTGHDNLFRETVRALYAPQSLESGSDAKRPWLQRLKDDGVFLIDLAPLPVNYHGAVQRKSLLEDNITGAVRRAKALQPDGVILIKQIVFDLLASPLRAASLPLLHDEFIPFPGSGQQKRFRERFAAAVQQLERT
jgi:hypothetical protein